MLYHSLTFLLLFLPVSLLVYYLLPGKLRNGFLLACSAAFLLLGDFWYAPAALLSAVADYLLGLGIGKAQNPVRRRRFLFLGIVKDGALLLLLKQYAGMPAVYYAAYPMLHLLVPLGIIVTALRSLSYLADVYTGAVPVQTRFVPLALYLLFYPALPFGPVIRYRDFLPALAPDSRSIDRDSFLRGLWCFAKGTAKLVLLGEQFQSLWLMFSEKMSPATTILPALGALLCAAFGLFFLWSGSRDAARGLSALYGFPCNNRPESPFKALGISEFLRRIDSDLFLWLNTYAYAPGITANNPIIRWIMNVILFFVFRSFFAGDLTTLAVWLIGLGAYLLLDLLLYRKVLIRLRKGVQRLYMLLLFSFCVMLFVLPDISQLRAFLNALIRFSSFLSLDPMMETFARPMLTMLLLGSSVGVLGLCGSRLHKGKETLNLLLLLPASLLLLGLVLVFLV